MVLLGSFLFHSWNWFFLQHKGHFWGFLTHFSISTKGSVWYAIVYTLFLEIKKLKLWQKWSIKTPMTIFWNLLNGTSRAVWSTDVFDIDPRKYFWKGQAMTTFDLKLHAWHTKWPPLKISFSRSRQNWSSSSAFTKNSWHFDDENVKSTFCWRSLGKNPILAGKICTNIVKQKNDSHALIFVLFLFSATF